MIRPDEENLSENLLFCRREGTVGALAADGKEGGERSQLSAALRQQGAPVTMRVSNKRFSAPADGGIGKQR